MQWRLKFNLVIQDLGIKSRKFETFSAFCAQRPGWSKYTLLYLKPSPGSRGNAIVKVRPGRGQVRDGVVLLRHPSRLNRVRRRRDFSREVESQVKVDLFALLIDHHRGGGGFVGEVEGRGDGAVDRVPRHDPVSTDRPLSLMMHRGRQSTLSCDCFVCPSSEM
jgi:hypothetical protein